MLKSGSVCDSGGADLHDGSREQFIWTCRFFAVSENEVTMRQHVTAAQDLQ
jgi:hypothetical protein